METETGTEYKHCALSMGEQVYKKIDNHIRILQHSEQKNLTKRKWVADAIKEKLEREVEINHNNIPKEKHLSFKIETVLHEEVEKRIELIRKFRRSFSKKQWILEALLEKIEKEEKITNQILSDLKGS